jgi:hypothetical protein
LFVNAIHESTRANLYSTLIWVISLVSIALVLIRPKGWPEAIWAVAGACLLTIFGLISLRNAAAAKGTDVYLFLTGMMIISELAPCQSLRLGGRPCGASIQGIVGATLRAHLSGRHARHRVSFQ